MILLQLFLVFFNIGLLTFGGGYAMLPMIQSETERYHWLTPEELIDFIAISESTPGPFAVNISTFVGMETAGFPGAACGTLGVTIPSFLVILFVARHYDQFRKSRIVNGCMAGLKPAVIGMLAASLFSLVQTVLVPETGFTWNSPIFYISVLILFIMGILSFRKMHPIIIIFLSAFMGIGMGYLTEIL